MADNNYISPSGMQPKVGWTPEGFLGGYLYGDQERDYKNVLGMSNASSLMGLQKQGNELQDYALNALVREAERKANIAKAQATEQYAVPQAGANLQQTISSTASNDASRAGTLIDNQTRGGKNQAELDKVTLENRGRQLEQTMSVLSIAQQGGPAALPYAMQEAKKIGMPESLVQQMFANPQAFAEKVAKTKQSYIEKMAERELQNKGAVAAAQARPTPANPRMVMLEALAQNALDTGEAKTSQEAWNIATRTYIRDTKPVDNNQGAGQKQMQKEAGDQVVVLSARLAKAIKNKAPKEDIESLQTQIRLMKEMAGPVLPSVGGASTYNLGGREVIKIVPSGAK